MLASLLYIATCPAYIHALIKLAYGAKWAETDAAWLLALYGVYLLAMGTNGLAEALRDATAPPRLLEVFLLCHQAPSFAAWVAASVALHLLLGSGLLLLVGPAGLLLGSILSTVARLIYSIRSAAGLQKALPHSTSAVWSPDASCACRLVTLAGFVAGRPQLALGYLPAPTGWLCQRGCLAALSLFAGL